MQNILHKWIGDRNFYKMVAAVAIPLVIQQAFNTLVSLLDNIMIGRVGTLAMSAVSISNQLINILFMAIIGSVNASGIFSAQYYGKKDKEGMQSCLQLKILLAILFFALGAFIFVRFGENLVSMYMGSEANSAADVETTIGYAREYIGIMIYGILPYGLSFAFSSSMRDTGKTIWAMWGSVSGVIVNFILNYILIFGKFGFPELGVSGAAIATVISRYVEFAIILIGSYLHKHNQFFYIDGLFRKWRITKDLVKKMLVKGAPLVMNEIIWSMGLAAISQRYSSRGLEAIAAVNINDTIFNLFGMSSMAMGTSVSIIIGQKLGAGELAEAKDLDRKLLGFSMMISLGLSVILLFLAPVLPELYNTSETVKEIAADLIRITVLCLPINSIYTTCYFTMRAGGMTTLTFLFDGAYTCTVTYLTATVLTIFTSLDIVMVVLIVKLMDIPKLVLGLYLLSKDVWLNNLLSEPEG